MIWIPVPEPVTWTLPEPVEAGGMTYVTVTLSAPTGEDILKATAIPGASGMDVTIRVIEAASAEHVPYDVLKKCPEWMLTQMADYIQEFAGVPAPDPLVAWRQARLAARLAEASAGTNPAAS